MEGEVIVLDHNEILLRCKYQPYGLLYHLELTSQSDLGRQVRIPSSAIFWVPGENVRLPLGSKFSGQLGTLLNRLKVDFKAGLLLSLDDPLGCGSIEQMPNDPALQLLEFRYLRSFETDQAFGLLSVPGLQALTEPDILRNRMMGYLSANATGWRCDLCQVRMNSWHAHCLDCLHGIDFCDTCAADARRLHYAAGRCTLDCSLCRHFKESHQMERTNRSVRAMFDELNTGRCASTLLGAFRMFADRPLFGRRAADRSFQYESYSSVAKSLGRLTARLRSLAKAGQHWLLLAESSPTWLLTEWACLLASLVFVPLATTLTAADLASVAQSTAAVGVCVSASQLSNVRKILGPDCPLKSVILIDESATQGVEGHWPEQVQFIAWDEILAQPFLKQSLDPAQLTPRAPDDPVSLTYSSGSTGKPKGVLITEHMWFRRAIRFVSADPLVELCWRQLSHMSPRIAAMDMLCNGGRLAFTASDFSAFFEDCQRVRPTVLNAVPALVSHVRAEHDRLLAQLLALHPTLDAQSVAAGLRAGFRRLFGDRLFHLSVGSAAISPALKTWFGELLGLPCSEGYGTTETGPIMTDGRISAEKWRLVDCPELGYSTSDKPFPRGELLVHNSSNMTPGYHGAGEGKPTSDDDDPFVLLDGLRYFRTGDIVEIEGCNGPSPQLRVIDRKKFLFKLAQGSYVAPFPLEAAYEASPLVEQVLVFGQVTWNFVVAVAVINRNAVKAWLRHGEAKGETHSDQQATESIDSQGRQSEGEDLSSLTSPRVQHAIVTEFVRLGTKVKVRPYELPRAVVLETERWTLDNGGLNASLKLSRASLERRYSERMAQAYASAAAQQSRQDSPFAAAVREVLGDKALGENLLALGGDSIAAAQLSRRLEVDQIFISPADLLRAERLSEDLLVGRTPQTQPAAAAQAIDWLAIFSEEQARLDSLVQPLRSVRAPPLRQIKSNRKESVLLTGATGFVGAFLLVALLNVGYKVVCLVRSPEVDEALARHLALLGLDLTREQQARVRCVRGDLSQARLGLSEQEWTNLTGTISRLYHCASNVNHQLPFAQLRPANVNPVAHLAEFASTAVNKQLNVVSSMSLASCCTFPGPVFPEVTRKTQLDLAFSESKMNRASGYGQSKFIAELLTFHAFEKLGLKGSIYRLGFVTWAESTGAANQADWLIRFCRAVLTVGHYPLTPFENECFESTPVEWLAARLVDLSISGKSPAYNLTNAKQPVRYSWLWLAANQLGLNLQPLAERHWLTLCRQQLPPSHPFYPLLPSWALPHFAGESSNLNAGSPPPAQPPYLQQLWRWLCAQDQPAKA